MKALQLLGSVALLASTLSSLAHAEPRDFTSTDGNVIRAEIVSHKAGKVILKRADGKEFEVAPNVFSSGDQSFIEEWMKKNPETIAYRLDISADKKKISGDTKNMGYKVVKNEKWSFLIALKNISRDPASNLTVKYRVFYSNSADGAYSASSSNQSDLAMIEGEAKLEAELDYNRTLQVTTTPVQIDVVDYDGGGSRYKDELKGCLVRVLSPNGEVILDWVSPQTAMNSKTWDNTTPSKKRQSGSVIIE